MPLLLDGCESVPYITRLGASNMWASFGSMLGTTEFRWIMFGLFGQIMFTGRFIIQWIASERAKKSVVTRSFWTFSILGSSVLSVYAIYRQDPVFIVGQVPGI